MGIVGKIFCQCICDGEICDVEVYIQSLTSLASSFYMRHPLSSFAKSIKNKWMIDEFRCFLIPVNKHLFLFYLGWQTGLFCLYEMIKLILYEFFLLVEKYDWFFKMWKFFTFICWKCDVTFISFSAWWQMSTDKLAVKLDT